MRGTSFILLSLSVWILTSCGSHESRPLRDLRDAPANGGSEKVETAESLLLQEIQSGAKEEIAHRLSEGLSPDFRFASTRTLLMESARWGQAEIVELLLQSGASVDLTDEKGLTVYDHAQGNTEVLRRLPRVVAPDALAQLFGYARANEFRKLKAELDAGIDVNVRDPQTQETLLIAASHTGARGTVGMLLRYPGQDLGARDAQGLTALGAARRAGHELIVNDLIRAGAMD